MPKGLTPQEMEIHKEIFYQVYNPNLLKNIKKLKQTTKK